MTPLVPIMLIGWVPFTIFLFFTLKPHRAVLVSVIGGFLLLPHFSYDFQGIPSFNKSSAIALGLILGGLLSGQWQKAGFKWRIYDLPMVLWCLSSIPTSLVNQLGLYDGLSTSFTKILAWGIPYLVGRAYFNNSESLLDLCRGIVIGGLIYLPLCLYEIRMSPQLSNTFYGFFPHSFGQHVRYEGFRPIVFMQHGLMVALWMAVTTTVAFWLWRSRIVEHIRGVPMGLIVLALAVTTVLCKTVNGIMMMILGCILYFVYRQAKTSLPFTLLILAIPTYIMLRITGILETESITTAAAYLIDSSRVGSLNFRLVQEESFIRHTLESPLFGWGGFQRNFPIDLQTGRLEVRAVDALWLITFSIYGFVGLITLLGSMLLGPYCAVKAINLKTEKKDRLVAVPVALSLIVILFMFDNLLNDMRNPIYILVAGAITGWYLSQKSPTKLLKKGQRVVPSKVGTTLPVK